MSDFIPLMPGINGGCRTIVANGLPHDVTFTSRGNRLLLTITPDGRLIPGPDLHKGQPTQELIDILVDAFGRAYRSNLRQAEDRARAAEAEAKTLKGSLKFEQERANKAETRLRSHGVTP